MAKAYRVVCYRSIKNPDSLAPCAAWVGFATLLNAALWRLNPWQAAGLAIVPTWD